MLDSLSVPSMIAARSMSSRECALQSRADEDPKMLRCVAFPKQLRQRRSLNFALLQLSSANAGACEK